MFSDFQCPYCSKFVAGTLPQLEARYVRTGKVLLAFRNFPLKEIHDKAVAAAIATECAAQQNQFWAFHDRLFAAPSALSDGDLHRDAEVLSLDLGTFEKCRFGGESAKVVEADIAYGLAVGVHGTPSFFLGEIDSERRLNVKDQLFGAVPVESFSAALDKMLKVNRH